MFLLVEKLGSDLVTFPSYIPLWDPQIRFTLSSKIQIVRSGMPCTTKGRRKRFFCHPVKQRRKEKKIRKVVCFCPWKGSKIRRWNGKKRKTFHGEEVCVCPSSTPSLCPSPSLTRGAERGVHAALQFSPKIYYNILQYTWLTTISSISDHSLLTWCKVTM